MIYLCKREDVFDNKMKQQLNILTKKNKKMRALHYLKRRFENAVTKQQPLNINTNDLIALNEIIDFTNQKIPKHDSELEDALLLFHILQNWKIEIDKEQKNRLIAKENKNRLFTISNPDYILKKLSWDVKPKQQIINDIIMQLRIYQALNNIPKSERIKPSTITNFIEDLITRAKVDFPIKSDFKNGIITQRNNN